MNDQASWDFRNQEELSMSIKYATEGYIIENADVKYLDMMRQEIINSFMRYTDFHSKTKTSLEDAHHVVLHDESNRLRLFIMQSLFKGTAFHSNYYNAANILFIVYAEMNWLCRNDLVFLLTCLIIRTMFFLFMQTHGMAYLHMN